MSTIGDGVLALIVVLAKPPRSPEENPWWAEDYTNVQKTRDRELFT